MFAAKNQWIGIRSVSGTQIPEHAGRDEMTVLEFSMLETEFAITGWHRVPKDSEGIVGTALT
jgi:hypothetical protein